MRTLVLDLLVEEHFLRARMDGHYARLADRNAGNPGPGLRSAKAGVERRLSAGVSPTRVERRAS